LPLLDQAEGYRARLQPRELKLGAQAAVEHTAETIEREAPQVLQEQFETLQEADNPPPTLPPIATLARREINVELDGEHWQIVLELSDDPSVGPWIDHYDQLVAVEAAPDSNVRKVGIRLALAHPFMERFGGADASRIEPLLRVAVAIILAEIVARSSGVKQAGAVRRNINELLRNALSKP
jgi:hypothetical protein